MKRSIRCWKSSTGGFWRWFAAIWPCATVIGDWLSAVAGLGGKLDFGLLRGFCMASTPAATGC